MHDKPRLSFWQIWNMSFDFLGIQFGWGLQMANMSSIYSFLGAKEEQLSLLWILDASINITMEPFRAFVADMLPEDMEKFRAMKERSKGLGGFLTELVHGLVGMPKTMRQLAVVQFFTWIALFCMWIYWTPATARQVFGGDPADEAAWSKIIETAGAWTGICFAT